MLIAFAFNFDFVVLKHLFKGQPSDEIFAPLSEEELAAWGT